MAGETQQGMDREEELRFLTRSAKQNAEAVAKGIEALKVAIQRQQQMTDEVKSFATKSLSQVKLGAQQGVQEAIQQAAKTDIGAQIKTAVQPTLDSARLAAQSITNAAESADRATSRLSAHRLIWKEIALCFIVGIVIGGAAVWMLVKQRIEGIDRRLDNLPTVSQQPDTKPTGGSQKPGSGHKGSSKPVPVQTPPAADAEPQ